jgi:beta-galactosidase
MHDDLEVKPMKTLSCPIISNIVRAAGILGLLSGLSLSPAAARERDLLDAGWTFQLGDPADVTTAVTSYPEIDDLTKLQDPTAEVTLEASRPDPVATHAGENVSYVQTNYNDSGWQQINLPHDWVVGLPFDSSAAQNHGYKAGISGGTSANTIAWYRHTFTLPAGDAGKTMWLEFDGIYRNALIWLNGRCIGRDVSGYAPISFDVTSNMIAGGANVLVVRVDASQFEGWFYEGAGIYRHVWLEKTDPVHVDHWGTYVATTSLVGSNATITVQTDVTNQSGSTATGSLTSTILDANNNAVTNLTSIISVPAGQDLVVTQAVSMAANLWSPDAPYLYNLVSTVTNQSTAADVYTTPFGIRTVQFDPTNGVFINGQHVEIQGICNHQDHAGVGSALPDRLQYFRVEKLKEMGCNAYRTSHNAPTEELLEACDQLGMLVLDETRRMGSDPESLGQLQRMVLRDRNHPSVFCWSLCNEEWTMQGSSSGPGVIQAMQNLVHSLDSTRLCTAALNGSLSGITFAYVLDVKGLNYNIPGDLDSYHSSNPNSPIIGTEVGTTVTTRGIYTNDTVNGYVASYDIITTSGLPNPVTWGETAEAWWQYYSARPWSSGGFDWTGFDYRGEPTPYNWPCISSHFGSMDTCGFPKDLFYYYQANWTLKPVLHVFPHWNWTTGQNINVWAYGNCQVVELFVNGVSLGQQTLNVQGHVEWDNVSYAPGTLQAIGYNNGVAVLTNTITTTGPAAQIALLPDRSTILADGRDVSVVTVEVLDTQGNVVPTATNNISFSISGGGAISGVGNGNPSSHEADNASQRMVFNGLAEVIVQSTNQPGSITLTAISTGLTSTNITITEAATLPPPAAPTGVAAVAGTDGPVTISWDMVPGAFTYNVKRATTSGGSYTVIAPNTGGTGFRDTTVSNLVAYYYVVTAVNTNGESVNSLEVSATAHFPPVPTAPTGLAAIGGDTQVSLSWTVSPGATSYNVKLSTTSGGSYTNVANVVATNFVVTGLVNGTLYYFKVSAVNITGESANSSQTSATPTAFVTGLTATAVNSQVQLHWNAHAGVTGYNLKRSLVSGGPYTTIASNLVTTAYTDTNVGPCQTYYYIVTMTAGGVESVPCPQVSVTVPYLATPFTSRDIGSVGAAGSPSSCGGPFTISGSGADIWYATDAFQFVYVPMNGDGEIRARVVSVQNTSANAKGGVMIRETLTATSKLALMDVEASSAKGIEFIWRTTTGVDTGSSSYTDGIYETYTAPYWVRLTRTNNVFQAYLSPDGITWTELDNPLTIDMAPTVYMGLVVCSHNAGVLCTAVFDNVYISSIINNTAPTLAPITNQTVNVGQTVALTATATDTDSPPQNLTFSLLNGPANATLAQINNTNATFNWRPVVTNANSVNPVTLKVTDNGSPSLSATRSFTITVNPLALPTVRPAGWNNGQFTLRVTNSILGPDYAVQASSNLVNWNMLFITNSPPMSFQWTDTNALTLPVQFYRIKVGPPLP